MNADGKFLLEKSNLRCRKNEVLTLYTNFKIKPGDFQLRLL